MYIRSCGNLYCDVRSEFVILYILLCLIDKKRIY